MEHKTVTLRSVYKVKEVHFQPGKQKNGQNFPFVKRVRYDANGDGEMILSDAERNSPDAQYFIPEDLDILITEGTTFDLTNPLERNIWESIKDSELIVPMRGSRDKDGNLIIDGDKRRYGLAEFYVDIPGEEAAQSVSRKKLINKAWTFIENDSAEGRLTKTKLMGKIMRNAPDADVQDFLMQKAEKNPQQIIDLYTSSDSQLKLLVIDAKDKGIIRKKDGLFMYADSSLGSTDDSVILFFKTPSNQKILEAVRNETYPDMVRVIANIGGNTNDDDDEVSNPITPKKDKNKDK